MMVNDSVLILIAPDCSGIYDTLAVIDTFTYVPSSQFEKYTYSLAAYTGSNVHIKFNCSRNDNASGSKYFIFDNVYEWEKNRDAYEHAMFIYLHSDPDKRDFGETLRFEEMTYFKPAFQSLQILNDTIYYFNHLKSQIDVYSVDLILLNSIHIEYPNQKNWKPIIIVDDEKNKAYTIFKQGAIYSLAEINLKDGLLKEVAKIDKLFPQKIKVNNGQLYFLYNDVNNVWGRRQLYKGELPSY